jgi:hypothetical protein
METEAPPLPYNINNKATSDVCSRRGTRIIGGASANQGDFPYQVKYSKPKRTIIIDSKPLKRIEFRPE